MATVNLVFVLLNILPLNPSMCKKPHIFPPQIVFYYTYYFITLIVSLCNISWTYSHIFSYRFIHYLCIFWQASLVAQRLKCLPTMQETWVRSLGWEDSLEKEMATHSSILAWRIPWTEEPGGLQSMGSQRVGHDWAFYFMNVPNILKLLSVST